VQNRELSNLYEDIAEDILGALVFDSSNEDNVNQLLFFSMLENAVSCLADDIIDSLKASNIEISNLNSVHKWISLKQFQSLKNIIEQSIKTKSKIVTKDEKESGIRAILNFGHTFGHAIEAHTGYKKLSHGAAITLGMIIASKISFFEGHLKDYQLENIINLVNSIGLDTDHSNYKYSVLKKYIMNDKKVADGKLNLIMIDNNYKAFKTNKFKTTNIKKAFNA